MRSFPGRPSVDAAPDVIVIGAGSIGCSIAYYLSLLGRKVLVLEREHVAAGASHVAPGMLTPQVEAYDDDAFFALTLAGRAEHGVLAPALRESIGIDVEYRVTGVLRVAADEAERATLRGRLAWQRARGLRVDWLESAELGICEGLLKGASGRRLAGGLWFPDEAQVNAQRLVEALALASTRLGAEFREGAFVSGLVASDSRVTGVNAGGRVISAETVVLAAGVGCAAIARTVDVDLPVGPVKGQVLRCRTVTGAPEHILWAGHCYLVPRVTGEIIVGATEEDGNEDPRPTLAGIAYLATEALDLVPSLGSLRVEGILAGLRPAFPDRYPLIGRVGDLDNLVVATGHFRCGILLGPLTGKLVTQLLETREVPADLATFGSDRWTRPGGPAALATQASA
jgi:glycine oxidase